MEQNVEWIIDAVKGKNELKLGRIKKLIYLQKPKLDGLFACI